MAIEKDEKTDMQWLEEQTQNIVFDLKASLLNTNIAFSHFTSWRCKLTLLQAYIVVLSAYNEALRLYIVAL